MHANAGGGIRLAVGGGVTNFRLANKTVIRREAQFGGFTINAVHDFQLPNEWINQLGTQNVDGIAINICVVRQYINEYRQACECGGLVINGSGGVIDGIDLHGNDGRR